MQLQLRQISKVVYEAMRAYDATVALPDYGPWEACGQARRDEVQNKVDAMLRGMPHAPASIRPTDQIKAKILSGIVGAFVLVYNPPIVVQPPAPPVPAIPPIPVEKFENPDAAGAAETLRAQVAAMAVLQSEPGDPAAENNALSDAPATISEALAQADANIAEANK